VYFIEFEAGNATHQGCLTIDVLHKELMKLFFLLLFQWYIPLLIWEVQFNGFQNASLCPTDDTVRKG